ncbi:hypothetical protein [Merismopedia glauca]|uniref:hypothetical protein n=1 Tax=Merismopedia glauca TaxID=292586 RepID=UPI0026A095C1
MVPDISGGARSIHLSYNPRYSRSQKSEVRSNQDLFVKTFTIALTCLRFATYAYDTKQI